MFYDNDGCSFFFFLLHRDKISFLKQCRPLVLPMIATNTVKFYHLGAINVELWNIQSTLKIQLPDVFGPKNKQTKKQLQGGTTSIERIQTNIQHIFSPLAYMCMLLWAQQESQPVANSDTIYRLRFLTISDLFI